MKIGLKKILKAIDLEDITIDEVVIVENKEDMPELQLKEYGEYEFIDSKIMYKSDDVIIVIEHHHKHHYYRDEYKEDFDHFKYNLYLTVDFKFEITHILDNYNKNFQEEE